MLAKKIYDFFFFLELSEFNSGGGNTSLVLTNFFVGLLGIVWGLQIAGDVF